MVSTNLTEEKLIEGRRAAKRARKPATVVEGNQSPKPHDVELEKQDVPVAVSESVVISQEKNPAKSKKKPTARKEKMTPKASAAVTVMPHNLTESSIKKSECAPPVVPSKRSRTITEIDPNMTQQVCIDDEGQAEESKP